MRRCWTRPRLARAAHASPGTFWGKPPAEAGMASGPVQRRKVFRRAPLWLGGRPPLGRRPGDWSLLSWNCASETWGLAGNWWELRSWKGDSLASGVKDQRLDYHFMSVASAWPPEVQLEPEDRDSFSSPLIKREVSSPLQFSLQY